MSLLKVRQFSIDQNDTFTFANANITGNINSGNANLGNLVIANYFSGNGNALSSLQGSNVVGQVANATVAGTVYTAAQPNITSTGTLTGLTVTGNVALSGANVSLGTVANLRITGGSNGYVLSTDGSGTLTWVSVASGTGNANISGSNTHVFFNDNGSSTLGASANFAFDKTTKTLTVDNIVANGAGLTSIAGANVTGFVPNANVANTAYSVAGANVTGEVSFAATANAVAGANVSGAVAYATTANAVAGANVSGQVANALVAGTVYTAAQPNITSVGTLTGVTSTGVIDLTGTSNVSLGAVANLHISGGSANYYLKTDGSGTLSWDSVPTTTMTVDTFVGDGSWTMKNLSATPASINYTIVAIGGVFQPRDAYSVSTNVITFDDPPPNEAVVEITIVTAGAGGGGGGGGGVSWTYSAVSANTTMAASYKYIVDTSSANITMTLPSSGTLGDEITIIDGTGNASTNAITVARNGGNIQGSASDMTVTTDRAAFTLAYYNSTQGWLLTNV